MKKVLLTLIIAGFVAGTGQVMAKDKGMKADHGYKDKGQKQMMDYDMYSMGKYQRMDMVGMLKMMSKYPETKEFLPRMKDLCKRKADLKQQMIDADIHEYQLKQQMLQLKKEKLQLKTDMKLKMMDKILEEK
jgi:calcineurin-like phosphoesterase family protein